jgi:DNA-binding response OmpR family regulator
MEQASRIFIVLIEDDPDDTLVVELALKRHQADVDLKAFQDGRSVMVFLEASPVLPRAIVLDLNLPGIHGTRVLQTLKGSAKLAGIPVAVLTGSLLPEHRSLCLSAGARHYFNKPFTLDAYDGIAKTILAMAV